MAGDERSGDELFEDLDKFFAPIKDVEWDDTEPDAGTPSREEHVEVVEPDADTDATSAGPVDVADVQGSGDEDDWYDTGVLAAVEDLPGQIADAHVADDEVVVMPATETSWVADEPDVDEILVARDDEPAHDAAAFAGDADPEHADPEHADPEGADEVQAGSFDDVDGEGPSDDDLEAAAAHFAGSLDEPGRAAETYETEPIDVWGDDDVRTGADLTDDLGADEATDDILSDLETVGPPRTVVVGAEGTSGPSWQDVAAVEVGADVERRGPNEGERDVPAAFMTGLVLAGVAIAALLIGPWAFAVVAGVAVLVAQGELFGVMVRRHTQPATAVGLVAGALMMAGAYFEGEAATPAMFALGVVAAFCWYMTVPAAHRKDVAKNVGLTVLNMAWIPLLGAYLIATLKMDEGRALVVAVFGLTFVFDTAAFLVGSVWGGSFFQRALAPNISPKKSVEGLIGATVATVVVSAAFVPSFIGAFENQRIDALLLALVIAVAATLGDLAESLVKRDLGIKDMGSILPGHGGVLDRIDSLLFVAPAAFLLFRVLAD